MVHGTYGTNAKTAIQMTQWFTVHTILCPRDVTLVRGEGGGGVTSSSRAADRRGGAGRGDLTWPLAGGQLASWWLVLAPSTPQHRQQV